MVNKTQVLYIHGGMTFKTKEDYIDWLKTREITLEGEPHWGQGYLNEELKDDFHLIKPRMPCGDFAKYEEWKILFERYLPLLDEDFILIGESLGGIFLAKYLSENKLPKKALSAYLVCPPFDDDLVGEDLAGGFELKEDLSMLEENTENLYLMFSKDDDVVPVSHAEKFRERLDNAEIIIYDSKNGHFQVPEFPEIIEMIKGEIK